VLRANPLLFANTDEECQFAALWAAIHCSPRHSMNPM
jgi:hypothetical protein